MENAFSEIEGIIILIGYGILMFLIAVYYLQPSKTKMLNELKTYVLLHLMLDTEEF